MNVILIKICILQDKLPPGGIILAGLFASDKLQLTQYSGSKGVHVVYCSLGNIQSNIRSQSHNKAWVPIALLPEFSKDKIDKIKKTTYKEDIRKLKREIFNEGYDIILDRLIPIAKQ